MLTETMRSELHSLDILDDVTHNFLCHYNADYFAHSERDRQTDKDDHNTHKIHSSKESVYCGKNARKKRDNNTVDLLLDQTGNDAAAGSTLQS